MTAPTVPPIDNVDTPEPESAPPAGRSKRGRHARTLLLIIGAPILVVVLAFGAFRMFSPHIYSGTVMQAPTAAPSMDGLVWTDGSPVDLAAFEGDVVVLYFGYTYCPDVCPTTLAQVRQSLRRLGDDADRVHVMMVSVDPERDEPARLGDYMSSFGPEFVGATGPIEAIERVASTYGVFFARGEEYDDGGYAMDHTASLMGIDTDGHLRILWPSTLDADTLAADLDALL